MATILIVDPNLLIRHGFRKLLEREYPGSIIGDARNRDEAFTELAKRQCNLIVLGISFSEVGEFQLLRDFHQSFPSTPVLVLGPCMDPRHARTAHDLGAAGYCAKNAPEDQLLRAIRDLSAGLAHFDFSVLSPPPVTVPPPANQLSSRERFVLLALANGRRANDIALDLNLSAKTISTFKHRILEKLNLKSMADLVRYVLDHEASILTENQAAIPPKGASKSP